MANRTNAKEVLRRYAAGERDFCRFNLRGQSFKNADLSGADFSEADIRGTNFSEATLCGANFSRAKAGLQRRWVVGLLAIAFVLATMAGILTFYAGSTVSNIFGTSSFNQIFGWCGLTVTFAFIMCTLRRGIAEEPGDGAVRVAAAVVIAFAGFGIVAGAVPGAVALALAVSGAVAVAVAVGGAVAITGAVGEAVAITGAAGGAVAITGAAGGAVTVGVGGAINIIGAHAFSFAVTFAGAYVGRRAVESPDDRGRWIRNLALLIGSTSGTNFLKADLTNANFTAATLGSTSFNAAVITRTCWKETRKLHLASSGLSILRNIDVSALLVSGNGYNQDFKYADLRGANLVGANLEGANLKGANLADATLKAANLKDANLTSSQCIGVDFTSAYLTGACLEAWNIDPTTTLTNVDCQFVFLLEHPNHLGSRERRPHDPSATFAPGDFGKLYTEIMDAVQILIRDGINPDAFLAAFGKLMAEHPEITLDSIQSIAKKGTDALVTLAVTPDTDKAKVERDFLKAYKVGLEAGKNQARLESARESIRDIKEIISILTPANNPVVKLIAQAGAKAMNNSSDQSPTIKVSGDAIGNVIGDNATISGTIAKSIQQLPANDDRQADLKNLLEELSKAIASEEISDTDKADLLAQLQILVGASQEPETPAAKEQSGRALRTMSALAKNLPTATQLVTECRRLLPEIAKLLGLSLNLG
ncbi:putative low-complexity protein [Rubidibacter lacunae KORDI 51-2]|uniref:Putative low-complexity protein n=1 Tax=Rubidibacter lacunae KORDI 51-2 TaxID=582515 RepID=U5DPW1_9CHRO|nr:pentapeptide repeat-containing protein [Rubidibacter lacunae]ERN42634.1 putative low-complexity protein [Rubidibacter lacunae KORDI 51-2]